MPKVHTDWNERPVDALDKLTQESRTPGRVSKRGGSPNVKGCPGNDNKEHVYAHVMLKYQYPDREVREYHYWGECIGCGHRHRGRHAKKPTGEPDHEILRIFEKNRWVIKN